MLLVSKPLAYRFLQGGVAKFLTPFGTTNRNYSTYEDRPFDANRLSEILSIPVGLLSSNFDIIKERNPYFTDVDVLNENLLPFTFDAYIRAMENPDRVGFNSETKRWETPKDDKYDKNLLGFGLDTKYNKLLKLYLVDTGRLDNPWLTPEEELSFRRAAYKYGDEVYNRNVKKKQSYIKETLAKGMIYLGYGKELWTNPVLNYALLNGNDKEFNDAVYNFYLKKDKGRANRHKAYMRAYYENNNR